MVKINQEIWFKAEIGNEAIIDGIRYKFVSSRAKDDFIWAYAFEVVDERLY